MKDKDQRAKDEFLEALAQSFGVVTVAVRKTGINDDRHYKWLREDMAYRDRVESIQDQCLDRAETRLLTLMNSEHAPTAIKATMFYLEKRGRKRGYGRDVTKDDAAGAGAQVTFIAPEQFTAEQWEQAQKDNGK